MTTDPAAPTVTDDDRRSLLESLESIASRYPRRSSAIIPALREAQGVYGWLSPEALEDVAEALEVTPAFAQSVASFYDMFHLTPAGKHLIEVCTNVSCALKGAGELLDEFEEQLEMEAGSTTDDGAITLRTVECLGACAAAPCVAVNHRYREEFSVAQVRPVITELRASPTGWAAEERS